MGSYGQQAALSFFPNLDYRLHEDNLGNSPIALVGDSNQDVIANLVDGTANYAVVPILTSGEAVVPVMDALLEARIRGKNLFVTRSLDLRIRPCLMARPGTTIADITSMVMMEEMARNTRKTLAKILKQEGNTHHIETILVPSNALAAQYVSSQASNRCCATVSSPQAAEVYGLEILARDIQDQPENSTMFLLLSQEEENRKVLPEKTYWTAISYEVENVIGSIPNSQLCFTNRGMNIEFTYGRLAPRRKIAYQFLMFNTHYRTLESARALAKLKSLEYVKNLRVFGSFSPPEIVE